MKKINKNGIIIFISIISIILCFIGCGENKDIAKPDSSQKTSLSETLRIKFIYPENRSEQQIKMAEQIYSKIDENKFRLSVEKYISEQMSGTYEVNCAEYYSDKKNGMFIYLSILLPASTPDYYYRELWYTNGKKTTLLSQTYGRSNLSGQIKVDNGPDLFYYVPDIVMGSPCQKADCYFISDSVPAKYEFEDHNKYFGLYNQSDLIIISFYDDKEGSLEISKMDASSNKQIQDFAWVDGKINIISGYGAK